MVQTRGCAKRGVLEVITGREDKRKADTFSGRSDDRQEILRKEMKNMKEYKLVYLNKGFSASRGKDLEKAEEKINEMAEQGWELQQITSPDDGVGALIGVFYKERKL